MKKRLMFPLALSITGMLVAACGVDPGAGGTPTPTRGSTTTPTPESTETPQPTPTPDGLDAQCISTLAFATEPIRAIIGESRIPTAYDGINVGGCDFTKPIVKIRIELHGENGDQVVEIDLDEPVTNLGFPLPETIDVPTIDGDLAPGEYTRIITVYTADGESKVVEGFQPIDVVEKDEAAQASLDAAKALWAEQAMTAYTYKAQWQCFCIDDYVAQVVVEVRDGAVVGVTFADEERTGDVPDQQRFGTMDDMFAKVQSAIDEGAARIQAEYDESLGFPANVFIDYHEMMADEEQGFMITNVTSL